MSAKIYQLAHEYHEQAVRAKFQLPASVRFNDVSLEGNVRIGDRTYINSFTRIDSGPNAKVSIGKHCAIGRFVHITAKTHNLQQPTTDENHPDILHIEKDVRIGDCVWIGDHVVILPGVTIGSHAVIGSHSVVKQDVGDFEVVGGVPARHLRFNTEHRRYRDDFKKD